MGLTFSDHLQPDSKTRREAVKSPRLTTPTAPFSNVLVSSGDGRGGLRAGSGWVRARVGK